MQPGDRIGKYVVEAQLGEGGNGAVFAARDTILGRRVAIKVLHPEMIHDPTIAARFRQEAQAMAQLSHPNVVIVHDFVTDEQRWALVMELIENGETLSSLIRRSGQLAPARALRLIAQTAAALGHAHRRGIVHRDVKPANVMVVHGDVSGAEVAKLTDFGIARLLHGERRTHAQLTLGTLWYLAPEQAQNSAVDARADVYALGCTFYEAIAGRVPFPYDNVARVLAAHVSEPPRPLSEVVVGVPAPIDALVMRCLAKNPQDRPRDGEELRVLAEDVLVQLEPPRSPRAVPSAPPQGSHPPASAYARGTPSPAASWPTSMPGGLPHAVGAVQPAMAAPPPAPLTPAQQQAHAEESAKERKLGLYIGGGAILFVALVCGFGMLLSIITLVRCS
jgi:serine/threonine-protein kinase